MNKRNSKDQPQEKGGVIRVAIQKIENISVPNVAVLSKKIVDSKVFTSNEPAIISIAVKSSEVLSKDVPSFSKNQNDFFDEDGVVRVGCIVTLGDILVCKYENDKNIIKDTSFEMPFRDMAIVKKVEKSQNEVKIYFSIERRIKIGDTLFSAGGKNVLIINIVEHEKMPIIGKADSSNVDMVITPDLLFELNEIHETKVSKIFFKKKTVFFDDKIKAYGFCKLRTRSYQLLNGIKIKPSLLKTLLERNLFANVKELLKNKSDCLNYYTNLAGVADSINTEVYKNFERDTPASVKKMKSFLMSMGFLLETENEEIVISPIAQENLPYTSFGLAKAGDFLASHISTQNFYDIDSFKYIEFAVPLVNPFCKDIFDIYLNNLSNFEYLMQNGFDNLSPLDFAKKLIEFSGISAKYVLRSLPVLPIGFRIAKDDENRNLCFNDLYLNILAKNQLLSKYLKDKEPSLDFCKEIKNLQGLIIKLFFGSKGEMFRGLSQYFGEITSDLFEKKVSFAGKGISVPNELLKDDECVLPFSIAVNLFEIQICKEIINQRYFDDFEVVSFDQAMWVLKNKPDVVMQCLKLVLENNFILITSTDQSKIYSFKPKISFDSEVVEVSSRFYSELNSKNDGRSKFVFIYVPLSMEAQLEASLLLSLNLDNIQTSTIGDSLIESNLVKINSYYLSDILSAKNNGRISLSVLDRFILD